MMAEHPAEVAEITRSAQALVLNLGNITDARMKSMAISAAVAEKNGIPFVIDLVGIACSKHRRSFAKKLIGKAHPSILKGNYSEIYALYNSAFKSAGVDADTTLDADFMSGVCTALARKHNTVILASGETDIISDGKRLIRLYNGSAQLATVTGTGCMLGALCGCYLSVCRSIDAATAACTVLGISGEMAEAEKGSGSFFVNLLDALSTLSDEDINNIKKEETEIEEI